MKALIWIASFCFCSTALAAAQLDGELVYQRNCTRCHAVPHGLSPRVIATVTHQMQEHANLTREEQTAVRAYLLETSGKRKNSRAPKKSSQ